MGFQASRSPDSGKHTVRSLNGKAGSEDPPCPVSRHRWRQGPSGDWVGTAEGPTAPEIVMAAANTALDFGLPCKLHSL